MRYHSPLLSPLLVILLAVTVWAQSIRLASVTTTTLGTDPEGSARLNGMSFQQDALVSFNGWQYLAYYESTGTYNQQNIVLGRRNLNGGGTPSGWQTFKFTDYVQRTQDSHNTISLGISPDGRIHLSYDHHDVPLNYRISHANIAANPNGYTWAANLFSGNQRSLPGAGNGPWTPVTYPRFLRAGNEFFFEMRIGASGSGDSHLYRYTPNSGTWSRIGTYIRGNNNNAYINGLDYTTSTGSTPARLHISWTWRETPDVVTNHDLCYAYSEDLGRTWKNSAGGYLGSTISPSSPGITVFAIRERSGILNQEGQIADSQGRFHVINREFVNGQLTWIHYWRNTNGQWTRNTIPHPLGSLTQTGRRAKLAADSSGNLFAILGQNSNGFDIVVQASTPGGNFRDWQHIWRGGSYDVEPLFDRYRFAGGDSRVPGGRTLSLFTVTQGGYPNRKIRIVDLNLA